jgi:predicted ATP-dependent endonuclease of OLD family
MVFGALLAVEEPENQLYPELLYELIEEFRDYARRGGQVFVSTHSPDFLNGAQLDEIYWLVKKNGFAGCGGPLKVNCCKTWQQREICPEHSGNRVCSKGLGQNESSGVSSGRAVHENSA